MLSKNEIKAIKQLHQKKHRDAQKVFVAEGEKLVLHFLQNGLKPKAVFSTSAAFDADESKEISIQQMKQISLLKTPSSVFAVFNLPDFTQLQCQSEMLFVLDGVRDPGNMGTILRLADWFGMRDLVCTNDCVDAFHPKVVQASMGAVAAVNVHNIDRKNVLEFLSEKGYKIWAADMAGDNFYKTSFPAKTAIVLGNEGQGVSSELRFASDSIFSIPKSNGAQAESLNVAMTAAAVASEFFRRKL